MGAVVVKGAQQNTQVEVGSAAGAPGPEMVCLAPGSRDVAAVDAALAISYAEGLAACPVEQSAAPAATARNIGGRNGTIDWLMPSR